MNPLPFLQEAWGYLPPRIRRGVLGMLFVAGVIILVMFAYLAYSTGEIHRRFGVLPTVQDLVNQTHTITGAMATKEDLAQVSAALVMYQDSLARLREHLDTTLITPGLMAVVDLQQRMARVERGGVETRLAIEEQRRQGQQGTIQLLAQMSRQSSAEERSKAEQQRKDEQREARQTAMLEALLRKNKINPETFDTR